MLKSRGQVRDVEMAFVRKDGALLPTLVSANAITDARGNFVKNRTAVYDISRLRSAERTLQVPPFTPDSRRTQDLATDVRMVPWQTAALAHGLASSASFPLRSTHGVFGAFTIYADRVNAFTEEDVRLLVELSDDLAFGIMASRDRAARRENEKRLKWAMEATVQALANTVEQRDFYTAGHQRRVAELAAAIARSIGLSEDEIIGVYLAGMIHDIGKVQVPAEILTKPGELSKLEYQLIQEHPLIGHYIVRDVQFPWPIAPMILQHHELDGRFGLSERVERGGDTARCQDTGGCRRGGSDGGAPAVP